jgi:hypothetical protein
MEPRGLRPSGPALPYVWRRGVQGVWYLAVLSAAAAPVAAQHCARPELGDQVQMSGAFASDLQSSLRVTGPVLVTTTGSFVAYRSDSISVVERRHAAPVSAPYASVQRVRVACGRNWLRAIYPGLVGTFAGGALATSGPGGGTVAGAVGGATLGALVGVGFAYAVGFVGPRWVDATFPPEPGALGPGEIDRLGSRRGKGRLAMGGLIVAVGIGPMIADSSLSDDAAPYVVVGTGLAIAAWGAASWLMDR